MWGRLSLMALLLSAVRLEMCIRDRKRELFIHVEYRMKLGKPFLTVQCSGGYTKTLEVIEYIGCLLYTSGHTSDKQDYKWNIHNNLPDLNGLSAFRLW